MNNPDYQIEIRELSKIFSRRVIIKNLSHTFSMPGIYGIAGSNGVGKSTFVKMLAHLISPTSGKIIHLKAGNPVPEENVFSHVGFLSPYLVFYEEFSAVENIRYFQQIRGKSVDEQNLKALFDMVELTARRDDQVKTYSSGMKQRLKLIFALAHNPEVVILDEPTSNLDDKGKGQFYAAIENLKNEHLILIASNELADLEKCTDILNLEKCK